MCPLYDERKPAVHGLRCVSPVCAPLVDCAGYLTNECTVPALVWQRVVIRMIKQGQLMLKQDRIYLVQEAS